MEEQFSKALGVFEKAFELFEAKIAKPIRVPFAGHYVLRYEEKGIKQAIIQKLARSISGLHAAFAVLELGFFQELCVLQRMIDDFNDEVLFLGHPLLLGEVTEVHERYLAAFYMETFVDMSSEKPEVQTKRPRVSRKEINEYIDRAAKTVAGEKEYKELGGLTHQLSTVYSGFVHGGSPQVMSMVGGDGPRYFLRGMRDTPLYGQHRDDLWNQFYRTVTSLRFAAVLFGDMAMNEELGKFQQEFEKVAGKNYSGGEASA